jgi:glycine/D-amino acid oxidase-like deaminating enzyme
MMELDADVLVVGGGLGGVAAALAAARHGSRVVLTEQYEWLG